MRNSSAANPILMDKLVPKAAASRSVADIIEQLKRNGVLKMAKTIPVKEKV